MEDRMPTKVMFQKKDVGRRGSREGNGILNCIKVRSKFPNSESLN